MDKFEGSILLGRPKKLRTRKCAEFLSASFNRKCEPNGSNNGWGCIALKQSKHEYFLYVPRRWFLKKFASLLIWKCTVALFLRTSLVMCALLSDLFWWIATCKLAHEWKRYYAPVFFWSFAGGINILGLVAYIITVGG